MCGSEVGAEGGQEFRSSDHCDLFRSRGDLYTRDRLHLNWMGISILVGSFTSRRFELERGRGVGYQGSRSDMEGGG